MKDIQILYCITYQNWFLKDYGNDYLDWTANPSQRLLFDKSSADLFVIRKPMNPFKQTQNRPLEQVLSRGIN